MAQRRSVHSQYLLYENLSALLLLQTGTSNHMGIKANNLHVYGFYSSLLRGLLVSTNTPLSPYISVLDNSRA